MKLSKAKVKLHNEAVAILKKDVLTFDDKLFVYENWNEGAEHMNGSAGAFFTPLGLARDFSLEIYEGGSIVDLCAGIGILSFYAFHWKNCQSITCIEFNPQYYEVGKKLLPEATWINASILDKDTINNLPKFNQAISNPPFGNIKSGILTGLNLKYKGSDFEFITIEVASKLAEYGTFILPQMSTPFKYSGNRNMQRTEGSDKLKKFIKETGLEFEMNCGIDTSCYLDDWKGVSPLCEIVNFDFNAEIKANPIDLKPLLKPEEMNFDYVKGEYSEPVQLTMF